MEPVTNASRCGNAASILEISPGGRRFFNVSAGDGSACHSKRHQLIICYLGNPQVFDAAPENEVSSLVKTGLSVAADGCNLVSTERWSEPSRVSSGQGERKGILLCKPLGHQKLMCSRSCRPYHTSYNNLARRYRTRPTAGFGWAVGNHVRLDDSIFDEETTTRTDVTRGEDITFLVVYLWLC
jgi:hypothetical protein